MILAQESAKQRQCRRCALLLPPLTEVFIIYFIFVSCFSFLPSFFLLSNALSSVCAGPAPEGENLKVVCPPGKKIKSVDFASFGMPTGTCGSYAVNPSCNAATSVSAVQSVCLNQNNCSPLYGSLFLPFSFSRLLLPLASSRSLPLCLFVSVITFFNSSSVGTFDDPCPGSSKELIIQVTCA